uniref:Uncharacterized protein n=1 Tax=Trichogramma kaykai TaxID=54128 RepID=A0ABD2XEG1_9HYME
MNKLEFPFVLGKSCPGFREPNFANESYSANGERNGSFGGSCTDVTLKHGQKLFFINSLYSCTIFATMMSFKYLTRITLRLNQQQQRPREYAHHEEEHEKGEAACICAWAQAIYTTCSTRAESRLEREGPFSVRSCIASTVLRAPGGCLMASCTAPNESSSS